MERGKLKQLLRAYQTGSINKNDLVDLLKYVSSAENEPIIDELLAELMAETEEDTTLPLASESLYERITRHPRFQSQHMKPIRSWYRWISAAAAILVLASGLWWYMNQDQESIVNDGQPIVRTITNTPSDKLVLKTSDGHIIDLDNLSGSETAGISTIHSADGEGLVYGKDGKTTAYEEHTIVTPKGRQYNITLSDGTKVWLNSATTITFPARFQGDVRDIKLDGEAYFEVKRAESWPFVVHANSQKIEVLGTHFNVNAYQEDKTTYTTLLEGKVSVSTAGQKTVLHPGQQAKTIARSAALDVKNVDVGDAVAWKDNMFTFNNEEIQQVMRQVSRWYDVEVIYLDGMEGKRIGGSIPRFEHITELMEALQATGLLHYQMKGGQVIIKE